MHKVPMDINMEDSWRIQKKGSMYKRVKVCFNNLPYFFLFYFLSKPFLLTNTLLLACIYILHSSFHPSILRLKSSSFQRIHFFLLELLLPL